MSPLSRNAVSPILPISTSENKSWQSTPLHKSPTRTPRQQKIICYVTTAAIVLALIAAILVVTLIVYRIRKPSMHLNSISFKDMDLSKNLTVLADVTVTNPNALNFKFYSSKTTLLYKGNAVGLAYSAPGTVRSHRDLRRNVTVEVVTAKLMKDQGFVGELGNGTLGLLTCTRVGGNVKILGLFKHHVDVEMNCTVRVAVATQKILSQNCTEQMWF